MTLPASSAATSSRVVLAWTSADGQGAIDMEGYTAADAVAILLGQCASDDERTRILGGTFTIEEESYDSL